MAKGEDQSGYFQIVEGWGYWDTGESLTYRRLESEGG